MNLSSQQQHEVHFWKWLVKVEGEKFFDRRKNDFKRHTDQYDGKCDLKGKGIEFGTGCFSMLEYSEAKSVIGIDPLADEYNNILPNKNSKVTIIQGDGENVTFKDDTFDWAVCWNVLDHTPSPEKMVSEMFRVIKPKGKIYFNVNFDDQLSPAHYGLWRKDTVEKYFGNYKKVYEKEIRNEPDQQTWYYAIYEKE